MGHKFATSPQKTIFCLGNYVRQREFIKLHSDCASFGFVISSMYRLMLFHIKYWEGQSTVNCTYYRHSAVALSVSFYISLSESVFFYHQRIEYWVGQSTVYRRRGAVARQSLPDIEYFGGWSGLGYHHCPPLWQGCTICQGNCKGELKNQNSTYFSGKPQDTSITCKRTGKFCICSEW